MRLGRDFSGRNEPKKFMHITMKDSVKGHRILVSDDSMGINSGHNTRASDDKITIDPRGY